MRLLRTAGHTPPSASRRAREASPRRGHHLGAATLFVAVFFRMRFGRFRRMMRGLVMMPTSGMRMMRSLLVMTSLVLFGSFFMMPRGVLMLGRGVLVMLGCFGGHKKPPWKGCDQNTIASSPPHWSVAVRL